MDMMLLVLGQTIMMALLIVVGYLLYRREIITKKGSREMSALLIRVVIPCVVVRAYITPFTELKLQNLLITFLLSMLSLILAMVAARIFYPAQARIERFGTAFSNAGFIGIPLVDAVLGQEAVFYVAVYVALLNIFQWTYGVYVMTENKESIHPKAILTNPVLIGLLIGLFFFLTRLSPPDVVLRCVESIGSINTPLAMIILGVYLAQADIGRMVFEKELYVSSLVRLVLIPLLTLAALVLIPIGTPELKMIVLLAACTPIGSNVAVFAQIHGLDYTYAVKQVCVSTILSVLTIPLFVSLVNAVL